MFHAQQRAEHVGVEGGRVAVGGLLRHRAGLAFSTGVVDGHIEATKARDSLIDQGAWYIVLVLYVRAQELGLGAELAQFSG